MNRARSSLPDRIPPSYYARPAGAVPSPAARTPWQSVLRLLGSLALASAALASSAWGMRLRVPLLRSANPAHLAAGGALAGCLLVGLVLGVRSAGSSLPAGAPPAGHARPPVQAAGPAAPPVRVSPSPPSPSPSPTPTPTPTPRPSPSAPAPITFLDAPLSSSPGESVTLLVRTAPGTACSIAVGYQPPPGLNPATANGAGQVSWTWTVSRKAPPGTWPITVTCGGSTATTKIELNDGGN